MADSSIDQLRGRVRVLGGSAPQHPESVVYIMSRDQRVVDNHSLLAAQAHAIKEKLPLRVVFVLLAKSGYRSREHYEFMVSGLMQVADSLEKLNISFALVMCQSSMSETLMTIAEVHKPAAIYVDQNPLRGPRRSYTMLARSGSTQVLEVDTHNIIPVWQLSEKQEVGAYTIRPKIHRAILDWLAEPSQVALHPYGIATKALPGKSNLDRFFSALPKSGIIHGYESGESAARNMLAFFVKKKLALYAHDRNDATLDAQSNLSPYLHFGQISALRVMLDICDELKKEKLEPSLFSSSKLPQTEDKPPLLAGADALLEELVVRKELSDNFCFYNTRYDCLEGAPRWAQVSLQEHTDDNRDHIYTFEQFDQAQTHDELWNAAQNQLRRQGKIHGYMRMYWAKKVLEWTESPHQAIDFLLHLNDFYSLDGGDPNGYVGILWSVAGLHDRPWFERAVYGKIRYMNHTGAAKRFSIADYQKAWL